MRAKLIVQALGKSEVQQAVLGVSPWKFLKALANLLTPPLQLVLPDEQAQQSNTNPASKPKKTDGKKNLPSRPAELDPTKLTIEHGAFCVGNDEPVGQVPFSQIGPLAVLSTMAEELPVLHAGKLLTNHGLALLVLNPPLDFQTSLDWATIRFATRCNMNQEPMLVSGVLVQLGKAVMYQSGRRPRRPCAARRAVGGNRRLYTLTATDGPPTHQRPCNLRWIVCVR